jgi:hypothetical protein
LDGSALAAAATLAGPQLWAYGVREPNPASTLDHLANLRRSVDQIVSQNGMTDATLDAWEETAHRLGTDTRHRPNDLLLQELAGDFAELRLHLARHQPLSSLRRLTLVAAQMAGLISLTLLKAGALTESRSWARTARIAADEADEPTTRAWVRAQEAYAHYYAGSYDKAIYVARQTQAVAHHAPCVGVALAAALEARAWAIAGDALAARRGLDAAEAVLRQLPASALEPSAFGYNEAQLRFHEGNAWTHLHDTGAAERAHQRALALYPPGDFTDRTLIHLDRAYCLAYDGDIRTAFGHAANALTILSRSQRAGLITERGLQILSLGSPAQLALPAARDFRDVLMSTPEG